MAGDQDKSSVLKNKDEFGKHDKRPGSDKNAGARDDMKHMAEKTKAPSGGSSGGDRK